MNIFNFIVLFLLTINIICVIILSISVVNLYIKLKAAELSTHKMEYVPFDPNWASKDNEINELNEHLNADEPDLDVNELTPQQAALRDLI